MKQQRLILPAAGLIAALLLSAACRAQVTTQEPQGRIVVKSVEVVPLSHIEFEGQTTLPNGSCLLTQLSADETPETWWPADVCGVVESGQWHVRAQLGNDEAPQELSAEKQYALRVWQRGDPSVEAEPFWFDLSAPPAPEE